MPSLWACLRCTLAASFCLIVSVLDAPGARGDEPLAAQTAKSSTARVLKELVDNAFDACGSQQI